MTNLDFIRKWAANEEYDWTMTVIGGEFVSEIDEENKIIYTFDSEISFEDVEKYSVWVNEVVEEDIEFDVKEFFKTVKGSIKFCNKLYRGRGELFSINGDNNYLNEEYLTNEWTDLGNIFDDFERGIMLVGMRTIEENKC